MRVLITGGAGFIGHHLADHFAGRAEVRILDNLRTGSLTNVRMESVEFTENSILNRGAVRDAMREVDLVFHLAAMSSVAESMASPQECAAINLEGTLIVLEEAGRARVGKVCLASTSAICGDGSELSKSESSPPDPGSPYAATKLEGERLAAQFLKTSHLQTVCLRFFNVFGPRQNAVGGYAAVVPLFIRAAIAGEPLCINGDGEQTRDFIFVKDVVAACAFAVDTPGLCGVFNVGSGVATSVNQLATAILRVTRSRSIISHQPARGGEVRHSLASIAKLRSAGFAPRIDLHEGLVETVRSFVTT